MLFGVYFVFAGINELIALRMEYVAKSLKKEAGSSGEKYINMRRSFVLNIMVIIGVLLAGAFVLVELEDWTFIKSLYFAIETTTVSNTVYGILETILYCCIHSYSGLF